MNIGFAGLGKLGLPIALAVESKGHSVSAYDPADAPRRALLERKLPFHEPAAEPLLRRSRIEIVPLNELARRSDIIFIAIQTPHAPRFEGISRLPSETRDFDYSHLRAGVAQVSKAVEALGRKKTVVIVSTVLPGTIRAQVMPLLGRHGRVCYNPFFIAMGNAVEDFLKPEFVLLGADDAGSARALEGFYRTIHRAPIKRTTIEEAEIIKLLYNTFISTKIAFANTAMEICHRIQGADVDVVLGVLKEAQDRIVSGKYLSAGMGDGGSCHPRDNIALSHLARTLGLSFDWFRCVMEQRERHCEWLADLIEENRSGRDILILGRSFKPSSDILTGSPSLLLEAILRERGLEVQSWDPRVDAGIPPPSGRPFCYFIGTSHDDFAAWPFEPGSVVLDPWRYVRVPNEVELIAIGRGYPPSPESTVLRSRPIEAVP